MADQNAYQVADWNGQSGERWVANQARLDAMLSVFSRFGETPPLGAGRLCLSD